MVDRQLLFGVIITVLLVGSLAGSAYFVWDDYRQQQARQRKLEALARSYENETSGDQSSASDRARQSISIYSVPSGAEVTMEGRLVGVTPVSNVSVSPDSVHLRLRKDGHVPLDTVLVSAHEGRGIHLFSLDMVDGPGGQGDTLRRNRSPALSELTNDTARFGRSPGTERQPRSIDRSALNDPAANTGRSSDAGVSAAPGAAEPAPSRGETSETEAEEDPVDTGILQVLVQPWGSIYIDGQLHEMDTDVVYTVEQPAGTHNIRVEHPVLGAMNRSVQLTNDTTFVSLDFQSAALIQVTAEPAPGEIYLDGRATGFETPARLNVSPGRHVVDVRGEGWTSVEGPQEVTAVEGAVDSLSFSLESVREP